MTQSMSMLTKIILLLLALLLFIHFYTGSLFDFTTHQIDRIFNLEDRDSRSDSTITQTITLAQQSSKIASELGEIMQSNQNCLHRIDMFTKQMFESNNIRFTSQGQTTRIEVLPKSGSAALTLSEIGRGVRLCNLHEIEQVEQLRDIIQGNTQVNSFQSVTSPQTVSTIEFSVNDNRRRLRSSDNNIHFVMTSSTQQDPIRIRNIEENNHLYFLKVDDTLCVIPVAPRTGLFGLGRSICQTSDGMLTANCVDGARSPPLRLERLYDDFKCIS
ncbi:MAG: hypothetical protein ACMXX9_01910 [Candidatus Woesearchaeota archaeon]